MTATLHADPLKRLRALHAELVESDGGECEATAMYREAADAIKPLERQLADADEVGSTLYFDGEPYGQDPAYAEFAAKRDRMIARHRERMKEGKDVSAPRS